MLGEILRKNRGAQAAIESYKRALEQDPAKFVYYARLGGVLIKSGQPDQALEIFRRAVLRFPTLSTAHYFLGIAARAMADYASAETELRKSLALEADNVDALAQLGFVLIERDRKTEAETTLRRALALNNKHFYANYDLGRLFVRSRRYEESIPLLEHAASLKPGNPSVHYQLFMALSRLKQKDAADRELATFKELDEAQKAKQQPDEMDDDVLSPPSVPSAPLRPSP